MYTNYRETNECPQNPLNAERVLCIQKAKAANTN